MRKKTLTPQGAETSLSHPKKMNRIQIFLDLEIGTVRSTRSEVGWVVHCAVRGGSATLFSQYSRSHIAVCGVCVYVTKDIPSPVNSKVGSRSHNSALVSRVMVVASCGA